MIWMFWSCLSWLSLVSYLVRNPCGHTNIPKGTTSNRCKTSLHFSNPPVPVSRLFGPGQSLSNTIVSLLLDTQKKSTFHQNGPQDLNITIRSSLLMATARPSPTTGNPFCTKLMRHGLLKVIVDSSMASFQDLETPQ